jgi:hypothetical protein
MENAHETERMGLVHRTIAFGLALATTSFIAASVAVVFTGNTHTVGSALVHVALAPFRAVVGG